MIVEAAIPPTNSTSLNLTVSLVDLPWFGSLTETVAEPLVVVNAFNGKRFGVAAATINNSSGYTITKVDDDNYTFATATTSSITEVGGGGAASAGPVTVSAWLKN